MFSVRRAFAVGKKETQELLRNWMSFLLSIVAPIILFFLFSFGFPLDVKNIPIAVLDLDSTQESRKFVDALVNSKVFVIQMHLSRYQEVNEVLLRGAVRACVVVPKDFSKTIRRGRPQAVQAVIDGIYTSRANLVGGYIEAVVADYGERIMTRFLRDAYGPSPKDGGMPVAMYASPWFNPTLRSEDFIVPGVIAIILIFLPPIIAAIALSKEKETGSILNMFCSPVTKAEYLLGKSLPYVVITYFNFLLFLLFTVFIFKVPLKGSLPLLLGVSFIYIMAIIGLGLLVAVLVKNQISAILVCAVVSLIPSFMYTGFLMPVICFDESAKQTSSILPPTYYIDFIRKLMIKGVGLDYLAWDIVMLALMAVALYGASILLFRKRLG